MKKIDNYIEKIVLKSAKNNKWPPLLLVHGAWHAAWCWEAFAQALNRLGHEVHYFSLPGHGGTVLDKASLNEYTLDDYVAFLSDRIDEIRPAPIVVGHSMGGGLLQVYLQNKSLPAAIMLASIPRYGTLTLIARIARRFPVALIKSIVTFKSEVLIACAERSRALFFSADNPLDYRYTQTLLGGESMRVVLSLMWPLMWREKNQKIKSQTPVYVISGAKDMITSVSEQQRLASYLSADLTIVDGQAHCLMLEPEYRFVVSLIDKWIKGINNE